MIEVAPYSKVMQTEWNAFNRAARNGHFMFDRGYMEYHADRFEDFSCVILDGGHLAGLLPANRRDKAVHSHQGLTFGGLVSGDMRSLETLRALDGWVEFCRRAGLASLNYKPLPYIYHRRPSDEALFWLHRNGAELVRRNVSTAIRLNEPGPWSSRRRRGAKKAQSTGLIFQRSQHWDAFWTLLIEVLGERHDAKPAHSSAEIQLLANRFPQEIQLYTAEKADQVVAGTVMFCSPQVAHAQYIASGPAGREAGALDGLYARLFEIYGGQVSYFDFGISNDPATGDLNPGLIAQKEEFGGSAVTYDMYRLAL
jgi:hypothetical protein